MKIDIMITNKNTFSKFDAQELNELFCFMSISVDAVGFRILNHDNLAVENGSNEL